MKIMPNTEGLTTKLTVTGTTLKFVNFKKSSLTMTPISLSVNCAGLNNLLVLIDEGIYYC
jgi:hypothetical protein